MNPTSIVNMTLAITMYYMPVTAIWLSHTKGVKTIPEVKLRRFF